MIKKIFSSCLVIVVLIIVWLVYSVNIKEAAYGVSRAKFSEDPNKLVKNLTINYNNGLTVFLDEHRFLSFKKNENSTTIPINIPGYVGGSLLPININYYYPYISVNTANFLNFDILIYNTETGMQQQVEIPDICIGAPISIAFYKENFIFWHQDQTWSAKCTGNFQKKLKLDI